MIELLLLDIKKQIAKLDEKVWILFVLYDPEFRTYAYTLNGAIVFNKLFVETFETKSYYIRENGDSPYMVMINKFNVTVHDQEEYTNESDDSWNLEISFFNELPLHTFKSKKTFVGRSHKIK